MNNRIRIIYTISVSFTISLVIGTIDNITRSILTSSDISLRIFFSLRSLLPSIIGIVIMIIIIKECKRRYKYPKEELTIKNNYFFIGVYLLIHSVLSILYMPFSLYSVAMSSKYMTDTMFPIKPIVPIVVNVVLMLLKTIIGIIMVVKDTRQKQSVNSLNEDK